VAAPPPSLTPQSDLTFPALGQDESRFVGSDVVEAEPSVRAAEFTAATPLAGSGAPAAEAETSQGDRVSTPFVPRRNLVQKMRDWLWRAA
jgi:hypothetical protein